MPIKNKTKLTYIIILIMLSMVYYIYQKFNDSKKHFVINKISIEESRLINSDKGKIFEISSNYLKKKSFFTMDINYLREKIEKIDWIKNVNIRRSYPDEVKIYVEEHIPVAIWNNDYYLDEFGKIFSANNINSDLPLIISRSSRNNIIFKYFTLLTKSILDNKIDEKIIKIQENEIRSLSVFFLSGLKVEFGSSNITDKINIFFKAYKTLNSSDLKKIRYIDMRYSNGFSVGWK